MYNRHVFPRKGSLSIDITIDVFLAHDFGNSFFYACQVFFDESVPPPPFTLKKDATCLNDRAICKSV